MEKIKVFIGKFGYGETLANCPYAPTLKILNEKIECCGGEAIVHTGNRYIFKNTIAERTKLISGCKYILNWNRIFLDSEKDLERIYTSEIEYFKNAGLIILSEDDLNNWVVDCTLHNYRRYKDEKETINVDCRSFCDGAFCTECPLNISSGSRTRLCKCEERRDG